MALKITRLPRCKACISAARCEPAVPVCAVIIIDITIYTGVKRGQALGQEINKQNAMRTEGASLPKIKENLGRSTPLTGELVQFQGQEQRLLKGNRTEFMTGMASLKKI